MTRRQMIEAIVSDQIKRGVVKAENKSFQIRARLKSMSYSECVRAYNGYFSSERGNNEGV